MLKLVIWKELELMMMMYLLLNVNWDTYFNGIIQSVQRVILATVPSSAFHQHMERTVSLSASVQMVITVILLMDVHSRITMKKRSNIQVYITFFYFKERKTCFIICLINLCLCWTSKIGFFIIVKYVRYGGSVCKSVHYSVSQCHSGCSTLKHHPCSMDLGRVYISKFWSPATMTSLFEGRKNRVR